MRNAIKLLIVLALLAWPIAAIAGWPVLPPTVKGASALKAVP
jgi:hypothetical protein